LKKTTNYLTILFLFINLTITAEQSKATTLKTITKNKIQYISLKKFAEKHNLIISYYDSKEKLELQYKKNKLYFSPLSSFCKVNNKVYHLTYPTMQINNEIYISAKSFFKILNKTNIPIQLQTIKDEEIILVTDLYNINSFKINNKKNGTSIIINTTKKFQSKNISTSITAEGWLNVTILNSKIDSLGIQTSKLTNPIIRAHTIQSTQSSQISFLINKKPDDITLSTTENTIELLINIAHNQNVKKIEETRKKWKINTIVLDAGHGGKDPGAIGINKLQEKTVSLDIARHLTKLLERNLEIKIINTRTEDVFIPLWKRTKIANNSNGDIFISIHANSTTKSSKIKGYETFLLRVGKTTEAIEVAKRENSVISLEEKTNRYTNLTDENLILATIEQNSNMKFSEDLAETIQNKLSEKIKSKNRGVKQAGFHVLVGAAMPNVLVEVGFLSNKEEANLLGKQTYRREIAKGLYEAIVAFKNKYEKKYN